MANGIITDKVKLGRKGQITIPKRIRDADGLAEDDTFIVTRIQGGEIIIRRQKVRSPEDLMLDAISRMPRFDPNEAWQEVRMERKQERA